MRHFEKSVGSRFKGTFKPLLMLEIEKNNYGKSHIGIDARDSKIMQQE